MHGCPPGHGREAKEGGEDEHPLHLRGRGEGLRGLPPRAPAPLHEGGVPRDILPVGGEGSVLQGGRGLMDFSERNKKVFEWKAGRPAPEPEKASAAAKHRRARAKRLGEVCDAPRG